MSVRGELLWLFVVVGVGTYLMRAVPLLMARRSGTAAQLPVSSRGREEAGGALVWFRLVAPAIVASLLVGTLLPPHPAPGGWQQHMASWVALVASAWAQARWGNLGLTVLSGVVVFGLVTWAI